MEKRIEQTKKIIKIVIFGPESTGKSILAEGLAKYYNTTWTPEFLREFALNKYNNNQALVFDDNIDILEGQKKLYLSKVKNAKKYIFCDTDALQTLVYSLEYYNKVQQEVIDEVNEYIPDLYILTNTDIPWEYDILRDKPRDRERIFAMFEATLKNYNFPYVILKGCVECRLKNAIKLIDDYFLN